jgi:hypothetical protein
MISEVLKEVSVFLETRVEPGELGLGELGVRCYVYGFRHGLKNIGWGRQNPCAVFDMKGRLLFRFTSTTSGLVDSPHLVVHRGEECWGAKSGQPEDGENGSIDSPLLLGAEMPCKIAESIDVDGSHLLDQDSGFSATDLDLRSERCAASTGRRGRDQNHRSGEERI